MRICFVSLKLVFGLEQAVGFAEFDARSKWKEYDEDKTARSVVISGLTALSGLGYFTAFMFKREQPHVTLVGVAIFETAAVALTVGKGIEFKLACHEGKKKLQAS